MINFLASTLLKGITKIIQETIWSVKAEFIQCNEFDANTVSGDAQLLVNAFKNMAYLKYNMGY